MNPFKQILRWIDGEIQEGQQSCLLQALGSGRSDASDA